MSPNKNKACDFSYDRLKSPLDNSNAFVYLVISVTSNQDAGVRAEGREESGKNGDEKLRGKKDKFGE